ncbi:EF-hand domain-containing protein [Amycolatopsis sp. DSM 110486]|uniref:EF-hand domain-containing protein n=1 Tax=Amycolatopsis sp. DSM 110486 TaxID=2865832 RepID=UPI001C6A345D|nr:EF-hand domain-containing protein [Amycolatopsis sp. DSM 110486]QYN20805.1 EF-hand domain-containing protein [Amycolatopsis sp. DSM 110486]
MASELQRRKISTVFGAMDVDGDGFLTEADFQALTDRWTKARGLAPGSPQAARLSEIMMGWWTTLLAASDIDRDEKVTLDEVLLVVDQLGDMPDSVSGTAAAMFEAIDENGDERISREEYRRLIETWNGTATDTDTVFPVLDLNGDGYLTADEFTEHWLEFWAGDNADAPGTWVFGRFDLPVGVR